MKIEPLENKWKDDYFDAFKKDIISAINHLKQQFDNGVEYDCDYIDKAILNSFPDLFKEDDIYVCRCGDRYTKGYSDDRCDESFCTIQCANEEDYECTECPPGDLIRLKKDGDLNEN